MLGWLGLGDESPGDRQEFLPAALELLESPPSPMGRAILWTLVLFFTGAFIWACLGFVDVVAVASGRIIPSGKAKTVQPLEVGVVGRILVEEGQHVDRGDLLVEMDLASSQAEMERIESELAAAELDLALARGLLAWNTATRPPLRFPAPEGADPGKVRQYAGQMDQEADALLKKLAGLDQETARLKAQSEATRKSVEKLTQINPISSKRADAYGSLYQQNVVAEAEWLTHEEKRITVQKDMEAEGKRLEEAQAGIASTEERRAQAVSEFRRDLKDREAKAVRSVAGLNQELIKASRRNLFQKITAPVSGRVQQLSVTTVGGVVKEAEPLMVIVPDDYTLEMEAMVLNHDIGFVEEGQAVEVKLEAFEFTQFGTVAGQVSHVSRDAMATEDQGLAYLSRIALPEPWLAVNGKIVPLAPGMKATAEIKIRERRLISFFLSPLIKYSRESLRER